MSTLRVLRSRVFAAILLLGLALVLAAACGGGGGDQTPTGGETPSGGETPVVTETPAGEPATAGIKMVPSIRFDKTELTIAADTDVTITADNTDDSTRHNFAVYTQNPNEGGELIDQTEICAAPCSGSVAVNLAPGEYFFRCEVHPTIMTGTLVVP